ncbi:MAG: GNAT family N-acetyltransferase [Oscillospiraceae bacterium]|nr:GNAT family N-acetyltransferase [Oscillospiraceae bacterium]
MIFKLADFSHKTELINLWRESFSDGEEFISSFINAYMIPEYNVPVIVEDQKIVSALYLVDFDLYSNGKNLGPSAYLFAAATKKEYRNRGYMAELILYAADLCGNRGLTAVFLFPQGQDKKLFDYYSKAGFETVFAARRLKKSTSKIKTDINAGDYSGFSLEHKNIDDADIFDKLYESYIGFTSYQEIIPVKDRLFYFKCASSYLDFSENSEIKTYFGVFEIKKEKICYVFYKKYKKNYYIDDIILSQENNYKDKFNETAEILADFIVNSGNFGENINLGLNIPPGVSDSENSRVPLAMLLPLRENIRDLANNLKSPVYINMFMNI